MAGKDHPVVGALRTFAGPLVAEEQARIAGQSAIRPIAARFQPAAGLLHGSVAQFHFRRLNAFRLAGKFQHGTIPHRVDLEHLRLVPFTSAQVDDDPFCRRDDVPGRQDDDAAVPTDQHAAANRSNRGGSG